MNNDFWVTRDAIWLRHSWKLLANRLTRDPKIVIHGNSCIILYFFLTHPSRQPQPLPSFHPSVRPSVRPYVYTICFMTELGYCFHDYFPTLFPTFLFIFYLSFLISLLSFSLACFFFFFCFHFFLNLDTLSFHTQTFSFHTDWCCPLSHSL